MIAVVHVSVSSQRMVIRVSRHSSPGSIDAKQLGVTISPDARATQQIKMTSQQGFVRVPLDIEMGIPVNGVASFPTGARTLWSPDGSGAAWKLFALAWFILATLIDIFAVGCCLVALPIALMAFDSGTGTRNHLMFLVMAGIPILAGALFVVSVIQMWKYYRIDKYGLAFVFTVPSLLFLVAACFIY